MRKKKGQILINADVDEVFNFIADWRNTPRYERYIDRIELAQKVSDHESLATSYLKWFGWATGSLYRYFFHPPTKYSGVQVKGLVRGGFWFHLKQAGSATMLTHGEFVVSRWKWLEWLAAFLFWEILYPGDIERQLLEVKRLIESPAHDVPAPAPVGLSRLAGSSLLG